MIWVHARRSMRSAQSCLRDVMVFQQRPSPLEKHFNPSSVSLIITLKSSDVCRIICTVIALHALHFSLNACFCLIHNIRLDVLYLCSDGPSFHFTYLILLVMDLRS